MTEVFGFWYLVGLVAGALHAWILWWMSQPPFHLAAWHLPRFLLIGTILFAATIAGGLIPAFAGWTTAYAVAVGMIGIGRTS